ncbi:hypothetical protein M2306_000720 [Myroides gitamensis]|uniref:hypothetical protein n=1 Tax=Myroides odoratus TaxID=256 RepID=UPI002169E55C|nr:hypothetical protein [Myroides odoratus]MCS4237953.1 hypothetical protein [Myroides odoratus]MDH6600026.1 hypothetical protein [Myroides gitamensis]
MILILTTEEGDFSHKKIIDWLEYYKADYLILTGEGILTGKTKLLIENGNLYANDINLTKSVSCVFYRRWFSNVQYKLSEDKGLNKGLNKNISLELAEIKNYLYNNLNHVEWIPKADSIYVNKINVLNKAYSVELDIPKYIVTNSKNDLVEFHKKNSPLITKAIGNFYKTLSEENLLYNPIYTKELSADFIAQLPENFIPSFFQQKIEKRFEYRILYFDKICYTVAILSQENSLTELDSRKNSDLIESRLVPINISDGLSNKIIRLMETLELNIGCLDFIHSIDGKDYFLEVNPVGQIGGYSERALLDFEEKIVKYLIAKDEKIYQRNR